METQSPKFAIDVSTFLDDPNDATEAIRDAIEKKRIAEALQDRSYGVTLRYLERRLDAARNTVTVGIGAATILVGLGTTFISVQNWLGAGINLGLALLMCWLTRAATKAAYSDQQLLLKLQIAEMDATSEKAQIIPEPPQPNGWVQFVRVTATRFKQRRRGTASGSQG